MHLECAACRAPNRPGARFCEECGSPLARPCPSCGEAVGVDKSFCGSCGRALGLLRGAGDTDAVGQELRPATIVALRPLAPLAATAARTVRELAESLGAVVVDVAHDASVAIFGIPVAQEDHDRRAILLAQEAQRGAGEPDAGPAFSVGVSTGGIGPDESSWSESIEPIGAAITLSRLAARGEIVVDRPTARLLRDAVELEEWAADAETRELAQFRLPPSGVRGELDTRRVVRHRDGRPLSHFVGRTRPMSLLHESLAHAIEGAGQVVGIVGEAGIGKSRLFEEFRRSAGSSARWVEGHCLPHGGARPYLPVLDVVRDLCGLSQSDEVAHVKARVLATANANGLAEGHSAQILHLLNALDEASREAIDELTPEATRDRTFDALRKLLLSAARREPMVVAIEDVHWSDDTTTRFLATLATAIAGAPILLLTSFRPGSRPEWLDLSYATQIALPRLGPADSLHVVQSVIERPEIPEALGRAILSRADGNPFFLEELALAANTESDLSNGGVPETVQAVLLARIDRLPEVPRRLLQTASVLGREFPLRLLEAVWAGPGPAAPHVELLTREEFLVEATVDGRAGFEFKHALTHDVAYQSLPEGRRRTLHEAAGLALEDLYAGRVDEAYELLAHHWSRTEDASRAVGYLRRAADGHARRYAHAEASAALREALAHARSLPPAERDHTLVELTLRLVASLYFLGDMDGSSNELGAVAPSVEHLDDRALVGAFEFWVAHTASHLGDHSRAGHAARAALSEGRHRDDPAAVGRALYILCREGWWTGEFREGIAYGEEALPLLADAGEPWWLGHCHFFIAHSLYSLGDFDLALDAAGRGGAIGEAVADPRLRSWAAWARGLYEAARGNAAVGLEECARGVELSPDGPNTAWALGARGFSRREAGDLEGAMKDLTQAIELARDTRHPGILGRFQGWLAETQLRAGDLDRAEQTAHESFARASETSCPWVAALSRRTLGRILAERGDPPAARRVLIDAKTRLEALGCRLDLALVEMDLARLAKRSGRDPGPAILAAAVLLDDVSAPVHRERLRALAMELGCAEHVTTPAGRLTAREREVLALITEGLTNKQIAARLVISQGTVIRHVANIFAKLEVTNRTAAARVGAEMGLPAT